jgi:hypothetical protein
MRRIIITCALAGILGVPAKADETLKFRDVQYVASGQFQQIGDVNDHRQDSSAIRGSPAWLMAA